MNVALMVAPVLAANAARRRRERAAREATRAIETVLDGLRAKILELGPPRRIICNRVTAQRFVDLLNGLGLQGSEWVRIEAQVSEYMLRGKVFLDYGPQGARLLDLDGFVKALPREGAP